MGYAQILKRHPNLNTTIKDGLNIIYQSGQHLLTLITDMLDLTRIEACRMELYPTTFDFSAFLTGIVGIIHLRIQQKGIRFSPQFDQKLPKWIQADEKRLRQILLNLLSNAVKFTEKGGNVTFQVRRLVSDEKLTIDHTQFALVQYYGPTAKLSGGV